MKKRSHAQKVEKTLEILREDTGAAEANGDGIGVRGLKTFRSQC